jgi:DNA-binding PadR family transcriptional regulator
MSVGMSLLAILEDSPSYGLNLKNEFEARTGGIWPLNVGQVYTTLGRFQRDGLVEAKSEAESESQKVYALTDRGRTQLDEWFQEARPRGAPSREELVLKVVMASRRSDADAARVIQAERRNAVELLQQYTRLKRDRPEPSDLGWQFLLDSLIFQTEARVRWLDACESRLSARTNEGLSSRGGSRRVARPQNDEVSL